MPHLRCWTETRMQNTLATMKLDRLQICRLLANRIVSQMCLMNIGVFFLAVCLTGCAPTNSVPTEHDKSYLSAHPKISKENRKAIEAGRVIKGMCPSEAIAAAGNPYFFEAQLDSKWPSGTDPQVVIEVQCSNPDKSKISLYFENKTQLGKQSKFKAIFQEGQAIEVTSL